jgi:hypothetical protein
VPKLQESVEHDVLCVCADVEVKEIIFQEFAPLKFKPCAMAHVL